MARRPTARAKWEAAHAAALATGYPKGFLTGVDAVGNLVIDRDAARAWFATPAGRAWEESNKLFKRIEHGARRNAGRLRKGRIRKAGDPRQWWDSTWLPANSNAPLIGFIVRELCPELLTLPRLPPGLVELLLDELQLPNVRAELPERLRRAVDGITPATLGRAIRRARRDYQTNPVPPPPK